MTFLEAMRWLEDEHSFPADLEQFHAHRFRELARRSDLFAQLPPLVVVAGSCGKASTARFLAFMLRAAGLRVGLGTKPPLQETPHGNLERYQKLDATGEQWLEPELFTEICRELPQLAEGMPSALGPLAPYDMRAWVLLRAFAQWKVDIGIVEANIGLRDDPAGAIPDTALTILTPIVTDHAQMLLPPPEWAHLGRAAGPLWHKLSAVGSAKVVVGRQPSITAEERDRLLRRPGPRWGEDFSLSEVSSGLWGSRGILSSVHGEFPLELSCLGDFQLENAATAAMAYFELGYRDLEALRTGARDCQIPGRLEVLSREPLQLLCVASSQPKVQGLLEALEPLFSTGEAQMVMVLTLLDRVHGAQEVVSFIATQPRLRSLILTQGSYRDDSRDLAPETLAQLAAEANPGIEVIIEPAVETAVARGRSLVGDGELLLLLGNGLAAAVAMGSISSEPPSPP